MTALPSSLPAGHEPTASEFQTILDLLNLGGLFYGVQSTTQSLTNNTWTEINMDGTEVVDLDNGHSVSSNTNRYTATVAGWYIVSGCVAFTGNATGQRGAAVTKNGTRVQGSTNIDAPTSAALTAAVPTNTVVVQLNGTTDWVSIQGIQLSGGALSTIVQSDSCSSMTVQRRVSL